MPKRKRDRSVESEYDYLAKKLKRIERKIKSGRQRQRISSSDSDYSSPRNRQECDSIAAVDDNSSAPAAGCSYWNDWPEPTEQSDTELYPSDVGATWLPTSPGQPSTDTALLTAALVPVQAAPAPGPVTAAPLPATPGQHSSAPVLPTAAPAATALPDNAAPPTSVIAPPAAIAPLLAADAPPPVTVAPPGADVVLPPVDVALPPANVALPPTNVALPPANVAPPPANVAPPVSTLDPNLLAILGEDPSCVKEYGDDIQSDLAIRLNHVATSGLSKEIRKELKERYLIPANCKLIKAPTLNPEIRASLIESQTKRDRGIENKQTLNACALSSLSKAITLILTSDNKNQELLKLLMDTARILGDIQHSDSVLRRFFILSTVKKDLKDQLEKTKIDDMLFGTNLAETLKSAKNINRSGTEIRSVASLRANEAARPARTPAARALNYRAPPASRRPAPAGGARHWRPTQTAPIPRQTRPAQHSYKQSSRQPQQRHRR